MQTQLENEVSRGYLSECSDCDYNNGQDDIYRFCPLCGKTLTTWEDLGYKDGEFQKGKQVWPVVQGTSVS